MNYDSFGGKPVIEAIGDGVEQWWIIVELVLSLRHQICSDRAVSRPH